MRSLKLYCLSFTFTFIAFASDGCGEFKPEWLSCIKSEDCVIIADPCGGPRATSNKIYSTEATKHNVCKGAVLDCALWNIERVGIFKAYCNNKKCESFQVKTKF